MFGKLVMASALAISSLATAAPVDYQAVIRAQLEPMNSERYLEGNLFMDGRKGALELTVQPKMPECKEGMMCAQVMPEPVTYNVEGAKSTVDHCGIITTTAARDDRPVDGALVKITVRHNQNNTCPTFRALKAIEVVFEYSYYNRIQGGEVNQLDLFETDNVAFINPGNKGQDQAFQGQIKSANYKDKTLTLELTHAGGCAKHAFDLNWGECKKVKVLNSTIDQCEVTLIQTAGADDKCEALVTRKYQIDLSGLAQAYIIKLGDKKVLVH